MVVFCNIFLVVSEYCVIFHYPKTLFMKINTSYLSIALGLILIIFCGVSYRVYNNFVENENKLTSEKYKLVQELTKSKDSLEIAISENSELKTELIIERQKVTNLIAEIERNTVDVEALIKYKNEVFKLKNMVAELTKEKNELKFRNKQLEMQRDSTILVLGRSRKANEKFKNSSESKIIADESVVKVVSLKTSVLKTFSDGKVETTNKANKASLIKISFMVVGNKAPKPINKEYYVQIIDSKNNIVGDRKIKKFNNKTLDYSFVSPVKFQNESLEISADLAVDKFEKGIYFVNVFDKDNLVSKTNFVLQ